MMCTMSLMPLITIGVANGLFVDFAALPDFLFPKDILVDAPADFAFAIFYSMIFLIVHILPTVS